MQSTFQQSRRSLTKRFIRRLAEDWPLYVLLLPGFAYVLVFNYFPMYGVQIAFKDYSTRLGIWGSKWVGVKPQRSFSAMLPALLSPHISVKRLSLPSPRRRSVKVCKKRSKSRAAPKRWGTARLSSRHAALFSCAAASMFSMNIP